MADLEAVAAEISFQLSQLGVRNAHHDFERLAFQLARSIVGINVLPATGPVSGGGDSGRDFESHRTYVSPPSHRRVAPHSIAFGCSIEKDISGKIREDVRKIVSKGTSVKEVHYFCAVPLQVAKRHRLQAWAKKKLRVHLEIYDSEGISTALALPHNFWIAARFLAIPPEIFPRSDADGGIVRPLPGRVFRVPFDQNPYFVGREHILARLRSASGHQALVGMGGIGKTQIIAHYAHKHASCYSQVHWLNAASRYSLVSDLRALLSGAGIDLNDASDAMVIDRANEYLQSFDGWLLLVDNADAPLDVASAIPAAINGHTVITARPNDLSPLAVSDVIHIEEFGPDEAFAFLRKRTHRILHCEEETQARLLAADLGHLPLALEQAAAYISETNGSFAAYRASYATRRIALLEKRKPNPRSYAESVGTTWELNFELVQTQCHESAELLSLVAYLAPDEIPLELFTHGSAHLGLSLKRALVNAVSDPFVLDEILSPIARLSLIRRDHARRTISVHRVVQEVMRSRHSTQMRRIRYARLSSAIGSVFPVDPFPEDEAAHRLVSHVERLALDGAAMPPNALMFVGNVIRLQDRYRAAEEFYARALNAPGADELTRARALVGRGNVIKTRQRYDEALRCFAEAQRIFEAAGASADVAVCLWGQANVKFGMSLWNDALDLYQTASRICAAEPNSDRVHLAAVDALKGEADVLMKMGRYEEACDRVQRAEQHYIRLSRPVRLTYAKLQQAIGDVYRLLHVNAIRASAEPRDFSSRALTAYNAAVETYRALKTPLGEALSIYKRGELGVFDSGLDAAAADFALAADVFALCYDNALGAAKAALALVKVDLLSTGSTDALLHRLLELVETFRDECRSVYWTAEAQLTAAACAHALGRTSEAELLLQNAETLFTRLGRFDKSISAARIRAGEYSITDAFRE